MPKIGVRCTLEFADGRILEVLVDQRDYAALEAAGIDKSTPHLYQRHASYTAARRAGVYPGTWEQFNTVDCVESFAVAALDEDPDGDGLDPTRSTPTAGSA